MIIEFNGILPNIHPTVFMVESALVIGDVVIGEYSSVWFNAVIRGDVNYIRIGKRTNVQDNSTLHVTKDTHPLFIEDDVTIGHAVTLHGCRVRSRCLIGMGAVVLDGAEIGEDTIVGAGALVTEGMLVPPRSLVLGMPAKVRRELKEEEVRRILKSAENYINYADTYRGGV